MPNLGLNQSDSKIIETLITQEKFDLLSWVFFAYGYIFIGVTNQCSLFKVMPRHGQSPFKYLKRMSYGGLFMHMGKDP